MYICGLSLLAIYSFCDGGPPRPWSNAFLSWAVLRVGAHFPRPVQMNRNQIIIKKKKRITIYTSTHTSRYVLRAHRSRVAENEWAPSYVYASQTKRKKKIGHKLHTGMSHHTPRLEGHLDHPALKYRLISGASRTANTMQPQIT